MTAAPDAPHRPGFFHRCNTYFSEHFPPLQHDILMAASTFGMLRDTARVASSYQTRTAVCYLEGMDGTTGIVVRLAPCKLTTFSSA